MIKFNLRSAKKTVLQISLIVAVSGFALRSAQAETIQGGTFIVGFDETEFGLLGLTTINSFDQAASNSLTRTQILSDPGTTNLWGSIPFGVNPTTPLYVSGTPTGRNLQNTNFSYNPADLTGTAAGQIGIGGTSRWGGFSTFVLGDYSLQYDSARAGGVYSGWYLTNNFDFTGIAFDMANITAPVVTPGGFSFSGDLYVKAGSTLTFFGFSGDTDYGNFSLNASVVPEPSSLALLLLGTGAILHIRRRRALSA